MSSKGAAEANADSRSADSQLRRYQPLAVIAACTVGTMFGLGMFTFN